MSTLEFTEDLIKIQLIGTPLINKMQAHLSRFNLTPEENHEFITSRVNN